jgi:hypothetical protein
LWLFVVFRNIGLLKLDDIEVMGKSVLEFMVGGVVHYFDIICLLTSWGHLWEFGEEEGNSGFWVSDGLKSEEAKSGMLSTLSIRLSAATPTSELFMDECG